MRTSEFDYFLPEDRIAQVPAPRGSSRLLVLAGPGPVRHRRISDLPQLLDTGDLLVVNNTKVIPARLFAQREETGGRVELLLVERLGPTEWLALVKPGRRARPGTRLELEPGLEYVLTFTCRVEASGDIQTATITFTHSPDEPSLSLGSVRLEEP